MRAGRRQRAQHRVSTRGVFDSYLSVRGDPRAGLEKGTGRHSRKGEQKLQKAGENCTGENYLGNGKWCKNGQDWEVGRRRHQNRQSAEFRGLSVLGRQGGF